MSMTPTQRTNLSLGIELSLLQQRVQAIADAQARPVPPASDFAAMALADEPEAGCSEVFDESPKREQLALVKTIGERLKQARELCNMSQSIAAKRLGYANPSKLSKVEGATDTNSIPLWLIPRAAKVYEVSVDFLFGFTDDWEGAGRISQEWLLDAWQAARERDLAALELLRREITAVSAPLNELPALVRDMAKAISRFSELNDGFEEQRGSATIIARLAALERCARTAEAALERFRLRERHAQVAELVHG